MSNSVDNRVVQMEFDNKQFEKGVKTTLGSLDKLSKSLKLEESSKGLNELQKTADRFNLESVGQAADRVGVRFTAMQVVAFRVLQNITDAAMRAGRKIASALTVQMPKEGFGKYEQKVEAVQTIMYSTGKTIDEVNDVLNKLMKYTDETSYSFADMTSSISKFTSAGIDLSVAEDAMEGIANWAATAGVGPQKAASAFYNLTQAMSAGSMKSIDWKSISLLNMNTQQFKQTVLDTTNEMIKNKEITDENAEAFRKANVNVQNFDTSLSNGWFSKEIMLKVFAKYADQTTEFGLNAYHAAQEAKTFSDALGAIKDAISSGWMQTWEYIFGNYETAKEFWTNLTNTVLEFTDRITSARNAALEFWNEFGGREKLIRALRQLWKNLMRVIEPVIEAFEKVFSPKKGFLTQSRFVQKHIERIFQLKGLEHNKLGDYLLLLSDSLEQLSKKLIPTERRIDQIRRIFEGLFSAVHMVFRIISDFVRAFREDFGDATKTAGDNLFEAGATLGDFITKLDETTEKGETFYNTFKKIFEPIKWLIEKVSTAFSFLADKIEEVTGVDLHLSNFQSFIDILKWLANRLRPIAKQFYVTAKSVWEFISPFISRIWNFIVPYLKMIPEILLSIPFAIQNVIKKVGELIRGLSDGTITIESLKESISAWFSEAWDNLNQKFDGTKFGEFLKKIPEFVSGAKTAVSGFVETIKTELSNLTIDDWKEIGTLFVVIITLLSLKRTFEAITGMADSFKSLGYNIGLFFKNMAYNAKYTAIVSIATSLAALAGAIYLLTTVEDPQKLKAAAAIVLALVAGVILLAGAMTALAAVAKDSKTIGFLSLMIVSLSSSLLFIAGSLKIMEGVSFDKIWIKLAALGGLITFLAGIAILMSKFMDKKGLKGTVFMLSFAVNLLVLVMALEKVSKMPIDKIKSAFPGLAAIIVAMGLLGLAMRKFTFGSALGLIAMAAAIWMLLKALDKYIDSPIVQRIKEKVNNVVEVIKGIIEKFKAFISNVKNYAKFLMSDSEEAKQEWAKIDTILTGKNGLITALTDILMKIGAAALMAGIGGFRAIFGFIGAIGALFALIYIIKDLCNYIESNNLSTETIEKLGKVIEGIFKWLGLAALMAGGVNVKWGSGKVKVGGGGGWNVLAMAVALWLLFMLIKNIVNSGLKIGDIDGLTDIVGKLAIIFGVAAAIGGLAGTAVRAITTMTVSVIALTVMIAVLSILSPEQLEKMKMAAISIGILMLALGVSLLMASSTKFKNVGPILAMVAAIYIISSALLWLKDTDWTQLIAPVISISMVLVLLTGMLKWISSMKFEWQSLVAFGIGIVALLAIYYSLKNLAQCDWQSLISAAISLSLVLATMVAAFKIMDSMESNDGKMIAMAGAMVVFAFALDILTPALMALSLIPFTWLIGSVFGVIAAMAGLVGVAALVGQVGAPAMLAAAGAIAVFSLALIVLGVGLIAAGEGFRIFIQDLGPIGEAIIGIFQVIADVVLFLTDGFHALVNKFRDFLGIGEHVTQNTADPLLERLHAYKDAYNDLTGSANDAEEAIQKVNEAENDSSNGGAAQHDRKSRPSRNVARETLEAVTPTSAEISAAAQQNANDYGMSYGEAIHNGLSMDRETYDILFRNVQEPAMENGEKAGNEYLTGIQNALKSGPNPYGMIVSYFGENEGLSDITSLFKDDGQLAGVGTGTLPRSSSGGFDKVINTDALPQDFSNQVSSWLTEQITDGISNVSDINVDPLVSNFSNKMVEGFETSNIGEEIMGCFADILSSAEQSLVDNGGFGGGTVLTTALSTGITNGLEEEKGRLEEAAKDSMGAYILSAEQELEDSEKDVQTAAEGVGDAAITGVANKTTGSKWLGIDFVLGFINGGNSLLGTLWDFAYNLGVKAITAVKEAINSNSPSKETMKIGTWFGQGLVIGIDNMTDSVSASGYDLGKTALGSLNSVLSTIQEKMNADSVYEPTIRPILDLTNVESGASKINSLLNTDPAIAQTALGYANKTQSDIQKLIAMNDMLKQNQNGTQPIVNVNVTTQELSNSTVDYLVRRVNSILGGKV